MTTDLLTPATSTNNKHTDMPRRTAAKLAGLAYLGLFLLGIFANFFVLEGLVVAGDAATTTANIGDSEGLFRWGIVAFLVIFALDVFVAWLLHIVFRPVQQLVSLLAAWLRLVYTVFLGVAAVFLLIALRLVTEGNVTATLGQGQVDAQVMSALGTFNDAWMLGLAVFGLHLITLGYLILKSGFMPRMLGIILSAAGTAYIFDTLANILVKTYADNASVFLAIVAVPAIIAELSFTFWLLLKAGKDDRELKEIAA